jgi:hypothetical protein
MGLNKAEIIQTFKDIRGKPMTKELRRHTTH